MAVYGYHWSIPILFGVSAASFVYFYLGPNWVWYLAGILSMFAIIGFWILHGVTKDRLSKETETSMEEVNE